MRITPRITPYVPKPRNFSPGHLARSAIHGTLTGNPPGIRAIGAIRIKVPKVKPPPAVKKIKVAAVKQQKQPGTPRGYGKPKKARVGPPRVAHPPRRTIKAPRSLPAARPSMGLSNHTLKRSLKPHI